MLGNSRKEVDAFSILSFARKKSGFEGAENNPRGGRLLITDHRNLMQLSEIANIESTGVQTHSYPDKGLEAGLCFWDMTNACDTKNS